MTESSVTLAPGDTETSLTLSGLLEGTTTLDITQAANFLALGVLVLVSDAGPPPGPLLVYARPLGVAVYLFPSAVVSATTYPLPLGVGVYLQPSAVVSATTYPLPLGVGVYLSPSAVVSATTYPLPLGVGVYLQPSATVSATTYPPALGTALGTAIGGVSPSSVSAPSTLDLLIEGNGLDAVSAVGFEPAGLSVTGPLVPNGDGTQLTVPIAVAAGAAPGQRAVVLTTPEGVLYFSTGLVEVLP